MAYKTHRCIRRTSIQEGQIKLLLVKLLINDAAKTVLCGVILIKQAMITIKQK